MTYVHGCCRRNTASIPACVCSFLKDHRTPPASCDDLQACVALAEATLESLQSASPQHFQEADAGPPAGAQGRPALSGAPRLAAGAIPFDASSDIIEAVGSGGQKDGQDRDPVVVEGRRDIREARTYDPHAWSRLAARGEAVKLLEGVVGRDVRYVEGLVALGLSSSRAGNLIFQCSGFEGTCVAFVKMLLCRSAVGGAEVSGSCAAATAAKLRRSPGELQRPCTFVHVIFWMFAKRRARF